MKIRLYSFILIAILLALWQGVSLIKPFFVLPTPLEILSALKELVDEGLFLSYILDSLSRFFIGFFIGSFLGILLGLLLGRLKVLESLFEPLIQFFRPISPVAWFPLIVLMLGIGDIAAIFVIIYAVFFPVLMLSITGVRNIPKEHILMARNFGASELKIYKHIILPGAFLHIASGLKLAAAIAWIHLVAGEMLGVQSGLGYLIIDARNLLRTDLVLAGVFIIGVLGFLIHIFFAFLQKMIYKKWGKE